MLVVLVRLVQMVVGLVLAYGVRRTPTLTILAAAPAPKTLVHHSSQSSSSSFSLFAIVMIVMTVIFVGGMFMIIVILSETDVGRALRSLDWPKQTEIVIKAENREGVSARKLIKSENREGVRAKK